MQNRSVDAREVSDLSAKIMAALVGRRAAAAEMPTEFLRPGAAWAGSRGNGLPELRKQLQKRFGRLPASVTKRVAALSRAEAEELAMAVLDAKSLKELFGSARRQA